MTEIQPQTTGGEAELEEYTFALSDDSNFVGTHCVIYDAREKGTLYGNNIVYLKNRNTDLSKGIYSESSGRSALAPEPSAFFKAICSTVEARIAQAREAKSRQVDLTDLSSLQLSVEKPFNGRF